MSDLYTVPPFSVILENSVQSRQARHVEGMAFRCMDCKAVKPVQTSGGTGYACNRATNGLICYACAGERDRLEMLSSGRATLYLSDTETNGSKRWVITNWPGTLRLIPHYIRHGRHNMARTRCDVWFTFEGKPWHGVQYGENSQLCHCRRIGGAS
jgi:hypothetical protein